MARMYPPVIAPDTKSEGEREIFRRLRDDPATEDWSVLHSLNIAKHIRQIEGEVDFVIIVPRKGVLFLEVKAAYKIRRESGLWYYGNDPKPDSRGPFKQVSLAMHSLCGELREKEPEVQRVVYWSAAIFPYAVFDIESPEWHLWQSIDARQFSRYPISKLVLNVLENARQLLVSQPTGKWFRPDAGEPDLHQCKLIRNYLRRDFEVFEAPIARAKKLETHLLHYTQEQFDALDAMEDSPRVMFNGPAGTGKTVLAIEAARRCSAAGARVLLVCFNRFLGEWLATQTAGLRPLVTAGTLHGHMRRASNSIVAGGGSQDYWERELPQLAIASLLEDQTGQHVYDELILTVRSFSRWENANRVRWANAQKHGGYFRTR